VDAILERASQLKQEIVDFVLDAEGDLAVALETYVAEHGSSDQYDRSEQDRLIDAFLSEGRVGDQTPLDLFMTSQSDLSSGDRTLIEGWKRSFTGLFAIETISPEGMKLMNWLTAKHYQVLPQNEASRQEVLRFKSGDILLTRLAPIDPQTWIFSGPYTQMGNLGKPKLAVAIGNFKKNYKHHLYSDAPELLEEAWNSVAKYHQEFLEFFGHDEVTMSGYELNKKMNELQEKMTQERLAKAGIDQSKSLSELAADAGMTEAEFKEVAAEAGADSTAVSQLFEQGTGKMVMPKVELPAHLKKAEQLTAITHPRWGQMLLPNYSRFQNLLASEDWRTVEDANKLVHKYLEDPEINTFIWHRLAEQYPQQLEQILQEVLDRPNFHLTSDLDRLLEEYHKPLEPELPEIASVPVHLHNLFQDAVKEVNKSQSKSKNKKKASKGFGAS
jgi:AraC-like DNA-binding protein